MERDESKMLEIMVALKDAISKGESISKVDGMDQEVYLFQGRFVWEEGFAEGPEPVKDYTRPGDFLTTLLLRRLTKKGYDFIAAKS